MSSPPLLARSVAGSGFKSRRGRPIQVVRVETSRGDCARGDVHAIDSGRAGGPMSLVGNLEDLSLGDILQIISLSRKSGVLALSSNLGSGRIVFRDGSVHAACLKGGANELGALLVARGALDADRAEAARAAAPDAEGTMDEVLLRGAGLDADGLEALKRESIEAAILEMFSWPTGDFSFDVRTELEPEDPRLLLESGVNAQYLAMEGLRRRDERAHADAPPSAAPDTAAEHLVASVVERLATPMSEQASESSEAEGPAAAAATSVASGAASTADPASASTTGASAIDPGGLAVVLIDPDASVLEWVKGAIEDRFARVHVCQQAEQGLTRIRQYLVRGQTPLVLVSPETRVDPLSGIQGLGDFVKRLKQQAPRIGVIGLRGADDESGVAVPSVLDGVIERPPRHLLGATSGADLGAARRALLDALDRTARERSLWEVDESAS